MTDKKREREERNGNRGQKRQYGNTLTVTTTTRRDVHDPLTPDGEKPRKKLWKESECWSPTVLERRPSLTTQVVPQIVTPVLEEEEERLVVVDDDPQTPRGQMIKAPTEPPALKPVMPLPTNDRYPAEVVSRSSSPCILSSGLCGWL